MKNLILLVSVAILSFAVRMFECTAATRKSSSSAKKLVAPAHAYDNCFLPDGCEWYQMIYSVQKIIICANMHARLFNNFDEFKRLNSKCWIILHVPSFIFRLKFETLVNYQSQFVLDNSFRLHEMLTWIDVIIVNTCEFHGLRGFRADLQLDLNLIKPDSISFEFYAGHFDFYDRYNKLIETCDEYESAIEGREDKNFIFKARHYMFGIRLENVGLARPVCPLVFANAQISTLAINFMVNSYVKKNVLRFSDNYKNKTKTIIKSRISMLSLENFFGLGLDSSLIDAEVFAQTNEFRFDGPINSIQTNLFEKFPRFKTLAFNPTHFKDLIRRRGIEWLRRINYGIDVNMSSSSDVVEHREFLKEIQFYSVMFNFETNELIENADFCLIRDFPLNQMIFFNGYFSSLAKNVDNCPIMWLMRYHQVFQAILPAKKQKEINLTVEYIKNNSLFEACQFEERIKRCEKYHFQADLHPKRFLDFMVVSKLVINILKFAASIFGLLTNLTVVVVIVNKENRKTLKEKQYAYMVINSVVNMSVMLIELVSFASECQQPFGLFCSRVRTNIVVQYFNIAFVQGLASFLRLLSNFTYVSFSINRLSLVGTNGSVTEFFASLGILKYMGVSILLSVIFSLEKLLKFRINRTYPNDDFPLAFFRVTHLLKTASPTHLKLLFVFDSVYNLVCYVLFTLVSLLLDVVLVVKMRETLAERHEKLAAMLQNSHDKSSLEKKQKENEEVIKKVIKMVVANALLSFLFKAPSSIVSVNDMRLIISRSKFIDEIYSPKQWFNFPYSFESICVQDEGCQVFQSFCDLLFIISMSANLFFYIRFDKKFKSAYDFVFSNMFNFRLKTKT